jgi:hypothetical protein
MELLSAYYDLEVQSGHVLVVGEVKLGPDCRLDRRMCVDELFEATAVVHDLDNDLGAAFLHHTPRQLVESLADGVDGIRRSGER